MITSIVYDCRFKKAIENEIMPHVQADPPLAPTELQDKLETCPLLKATYHETLRFFASSTAARDVMSDCVIGGSRLNKGSRLLIPYRQMLLDEQVFGADSSQFNPARFLCHPALTKHPSFRPFGGGLAYCPGRFIAQKEIVSFAALVVVRFNVQLHDPTRPFPEMNTEKPCSVVVTFASG